MLESDKDARARVLRMLYAENVWFRKGMTTEEIAARCGLAPALALPAVRGLFHDGCLRSIGKDRRGLLWSLTPRGVAQVRPDRPAAEPVSEDTAEEIEGLLSRLSLPAGQGQDVSDRRGEHGDA